jgi:peptidoglycan-associated lipoprotein
LRWSVENATDVSIETSLGAVRAGGSQEVFPTGTSTYTLIAKNAAGMDSRSVTVEVVTPLPASARGASSATTMSGADFFAGGGLDVYFDYDRTEIRNDGRLVLTRDASILKGIFAQDPRFALVLEGHCDERGSAEYNLGLGDRRAIAAKDLLVQLGLAAERVRTISYGKDRPVCTDVNEACYQRNRRVHLFPAQ